MKRLFLAVLLLAMPLAPMGWTGMTCTSSQQRVTYNTLYSTGLAVNNAYAAYNDAVVGGHAIFSTSVALKYNEFQTAFNLAITAAQNNAQAITPQNVADLANQVLALVKQFNHK